MANIGLVACVSLKQSKACEASELYDSPWFKKAREFARNRCNRWYILSAKYGLVEPNRVIRPYEETLNAKSAAERRAWAQGVWAKLRPLLKPGDHLTVLAGERYREHLMPEFARHGFQAQAPMQGLGIGQQLQWLSRQMSPSTRQLDLDRLYRGLRLLETGLGGKRLLSTCDGQGQWPSRGVYLFFEPGEMRSNGTESRVVRVGTHGVSGGSKATLWNRLRTHRGSGNASGNHRGSIFRSHTGAALAARDPDLAADSWGRGKVASAELRRNEAPLERAVSKYIGTMEVLWLAVEDEAGPASDRAYLERNIIGLLAGESGPIDVPTSKWLGQFNPNERIQTSGLWNLKFLDYVYSRDFLGLFDQYVAITLGKAAPANGSIAPTGWHVTSATDRKNKLTD
jgi:hypothetical protein